MAKKAEKCLWNVKLGTKIVSQLLEKMGGNIKNLCEDFCVENYLGKKKRIISIQTQDREKI